jgi:hypothetical protein
MPTVVTLALEAHLPFRPRREQRWTAVVATVTRGYIRRER